MLKGFREFILRGNVVDLAVGVVIGAAFSAVVNALVKDILTPFIAAIVKSPDFDGLKFTINGSQFLYGNFINQIISFMLVAAAIYFLVIVPMNSIVDRLKRGEPEPLPTEKQCTECLSMIAIKAHRCSFCTQPQPLA